ncbi:hypothetical protein ACH33_08730 [Aneurinibacillus sp. XH2]|uniref:DUF2577 family protein n=1 Tax=Aneurinibacillus sp. XH2 TaxID=1450761 RepID=UPI00070AB637|nr:DUF2577 family protein [Aneurinibacillus sp. XH2]AMA72935.1 hypothetical protein ACH33_08730 [Aneurinibacillus sp. XH2]
MQGMTPERFAVWMADEVKKRDNPVFIGVQIGIVSKPFPDIEIKLGEAIVLDKSQLIFGRDVLRHKRTINIKSSTTSLSLSKDEGATSQELSGAYKHAHDISVSNGQFSISESEIEFVDELRPGDEVILLPAQDQQLYYVLDKAVRLE